MELKDNHASRLVPTMSLQDELRRPQLEMGSFPLRRRRTRQACPRQVRSQAVLCACAILGLAARTILPVRAWTPPLMHSQGHVLAWSAPVHVAPTTQSWLSSRRAGTAAGARGMGCRTCQPLLPSRRVQPLVEGRFGVRYGASGRRRFEALTMAMTDGGGGETESFEYSNLLRGALGIAALGAVYYSLHGQGDTGSAPLDTVMDTAQAGPAAMAAGVQAFLRNSLERVEELGPLGPLYFGALYVLAEVLIIPAIPLTTAAGFLFGVPGGTAIVLASATLAAAISFQLGRTLLRKQVEGLLEDNPKFRVIDRVIAKEGFKIILLLRLSPVFPFALSNYLYGVTSVDFFEFMGSTLIGFFPGTLAYVYGGTVGKGLMDGGRLNLPWYGQVAVIAFVALLLKTAGEIATNAIEEMEPSIRDE